MAHLIGTPGGDFLSGTQVNDILEGLGGNDTLSGAGAVDVLYGGDGNDRLLGGSGNDYLDGGAGDDIIYATDVNLGASLADRIDGGAGQDTLFVTLGSSDGGGVVMITNTDPGGITHASNGMQFSNIEIFNIRGSGASDRIDGGNGNDEITAWSGSHVFGRGGDDLINLYPTGDGGVAVGGDGNDQLLIIDDPDAVNHGGRLQGGNGDDFLFGGFYDTGTRFDGDAGNDTIIAGPGRDYLYAGDGDDVLYGDGDASLPEYLLTGGPDVLQGGAGDDQLTGGKDKDTLTGGTGADRFIFHIQDSLPGSAGRDVITDFSQAEGDKIDLSDSWYRTSPGHWVATEFTFIGMGAFTGTEPSPGHYNGQVNYRYQGDSIVVSGDANGDKVADFEIVVFGHLTLTADDFLL